MRRNGCPKGCFWRVRFFSAPLRFILKHLKVPENVEGAEKKRTLQKHAFGQPFLRTTPSPLLWRARNVFARKLVSRTSKQVSRGPLWQSGVYNDTNAFLTTHTQAREKSTKINFFLGSEDHPVGWGSSTRRGGGRKVRALPRKSVFLGFRREESGMSREFCRDVPDP